MTAIEESKDLNTLQMDELSENLKVHEIIMEKDDEISKVKKEKVKSLALKAKHSKSSEEDDEQSNSDGEEYVMAEKEFKKFYRRKGKFVRQPKNDKRSFNKKSSHDEKKDKSKDERRCFRCGDLNHFIQDFPKPPNKYNKNNAFVSGAWSDTGDENDETKEDKCLMALGTNEPSNDKSGLGFSNDTNVASTSKTKPTTFVKAKNVEVDRNILLKAKAKVTQTRKVSIEKPQLIKQFYKPK
ncbi:hypothetical protein L1987_42618 [Smallanthus sonchifolius]|uniref:Uncharacterized protein n=1 Tax=Smallanthus sonchifolius TaxID=185202 RepID=A0ACB9GIV4_9ASTR|nr:hypothetical protein L1987_42618 [Smallanthus sonchifolius]